MPSLPRLPGLPNPLALPGKLLAPLRHHRRVWHDGGLALIEVRGLHRPDRGTLRGAVGAALEALEGVEWAEAHACTGRVGVAFDEAAVGVETLVAVVEAAEAAAEGELEGAVEEAGEALEFSGGDHPADDEPLHRAVGELAADIVGLGMGAFTRLTRVSPVPLELASLVSVVDQYPALRQSVERTVGRPAAEVGLAVANAVAQGLSQGPVALAVDALHRAAVIGEVRSRRRAWAEEAPDLPRAVVHADPLAPGLGAGGERPAPLPEGDVETYARRTGAASAALAAATAVGTRDRRRATAVVLAGLPKAARYGREGFATQFARSLADRGIVTLDPQVARRLDRIDTVVVDSEALRGTPTVDQVVPLGDADATQVLIEAEALLAVPDRNGIRVDGTARLGTVDELGAVLPRGGKTRLRELRRGGRKVLAVAVDGTVAGLVTLKDRDSVDGEALLAALRDTDLRVLVAGDDGIERRGIDGYVPAGHGFVGAVRDAQRGGRCVAVVSATAVEALRVADCGVGLVTEGGTPWSADLLCPGGLDAAAFVLTASDAARLASRRGVNLATGGAGLSTLLAFIGPRRSAPARVSLAVNGVAAASLATGGWTAAAHGFRTFPRMLDPTPWHTLPADAALVRLHSDANGLAVEEVAHRHDEEQPRKGEPSPLLRRSRPFLEELANPLTPVLAFGAGLSAAAGSAIDAGIVTGLIGLNAAIGAVQRIRTERQIHELIEAANMQVRVRRDGVEEYVDAADLVAGDIVVYEQGDVVAGDSRILEAESVEVDEATLTGESLSVPKQVDPTPDLPLAERHSMLYDGTTIAAGRAVAVTVATGAETEAGHSLHTVSGEPPVSGVERRLTELTNETLPIALGAGGAVTLTGLLRGWAAPDIVGSGVSLAVASVPEGLPFVANVAQLAAARRLATRDALVRNPRAVEALGRVDVLCFDKTGTLTRGKIKLRHVSDGIVSDPVRQLRPHLRDVLSVALQANPEPGEGKLPNETDRAVAKGAGKAGIEGNGDWRRVAELPFEPGRGFHAVLGESEEGRRLSVKGAPEVLLPRCVSRTAAGADGHAVTSRDLTDDDRRDLADEVERLARGGARVLAVASRPASGRDDLDEDRLHDLEFAGFLVFAEEVRPTAAAAVTDLRAAGVDVVMITGDHPSTAESIAAELGILNGGDVLSGPELDAIGDDELAERLAPVTVFARTTPAQKVRIVRGLQAAGRTVAMTGDGANDAASIRLADCGVAVGRRSAPAARDAADIVVTTNRIETIIDALIEGRAMWGSVRDALGILVGGNLGEIAFSVAGSLLGPGPALNARQLLLVNLLTDLAPAVVIALRPPRHASTETLLAEGPEASLGARLNREIAIRAVTTAGGATGAYVASRFTGTNGRAKTVALVALVGTQLGQTLQSSGGSKLVIGTGLVSLAALAALIQTPGVSQFFGSRPLGPVGWTTALSAAGIATLASGAISGAMARRDVAHRSPAHHRELAEPQAPLALPEHAMA